MTNLLGPAELRPMVEAVIAAHPDAINPMDGEGRCLYTDMGNPDHHCVVGQLAADAGWGVPGPFSTDGADWAALDFEWPVSDDGRKFLSDVQDLADRASMNGEPWSTIEIPEVPA